MPDTPDSPTSGETPDPSTEASADRSAGTAQPGTSPAADGPTGEAHPGSGDLRPLSDDDIRDALPDDLDAAGYVGPYLFPNNNRRRIPGYLYLGVAAICLVLFFVLRSDNPVFVNNGFLAAGIGIGLFGAYSVMAGWNLEVDERDALVEAVRTVGFPVGHASAQMGWRGLASKPTWRILLYSAEDPPSQRGLVLVDGVKGGVIEWFVEENPEDWSNFEETA